MAEVYTKGGADDAIQNALSARIATLATTEHLTKETNARSLGDSKLEGEVMALDARILTLEAAVRKLQSLNNIPGGDTPGGGGAEDGGGQGAPAVPALTIAAVNRAAWGVAWNGQPTAEQLDTALGHAEVTGLLVPFAKTQDGKFVASLVTSVKPAEGENIVIGSTTLADLKEKVPAIVDLDTVLSKVDAAGKRLVVEAVGTRGDNAATYFDSQDKALMEALQAHYQGNLKNKVLVASYRTLNAGRAKMKALYPDVHRVAMIDADSENAATVQQVQAINDATVVMVPPDTAAEALKAAKEKGAVWVGKLTSAQKVTQVKGVAATAGVEIGSFAVNNAGVLSAFRAEG